MPAAFRGGYKLMQGILLHQEIEAKKAMMSFSKSICATAKMNHLPVLIFLSDAEASEQNCFHGCSIKIAISGNGFRPSRERPREVLNSMQK